MESPSEWVSKAVNPKLRNGSQPYCASTYRDTHTLVGLDMHRLHAIEDLSAVAQPYYDDRSIDHRYPPYSRVLHQDWRCHGLVTITPTTSKRLRGLASLCEFARLVGKDGSIIFLGENNPDSDAIVDVSVTIYAHGRDANFDGGMSLAFNSKYIVDAIAGKSGSSSWAIYTAPKGSLMFRSTIDTRVAVIMPRCRQRLAVTE